MVHGDVELADFTSSTDSPLIITSFVVFHFLSSNLTSPSSVINLFKWYKLTTHGFNATQKGIFYTMHGFAWKLFSEITALKILKPEWEMRQYASIMPIDANIKRLYAAHPNCDLLSMFQYTITVIQPTVFVFMFGFAHQKKFK